METLTPGGNANYDEAEVDAEYATCDQMYVKL